MLRGRVKKAATFLRKAGHIIVTPLIFLDWISIRIDANEYRRHGFDEHYIDNHLCPERSNFWKYWREYFD